MYAQGWTGKVRLRGRGEKGARKVGWGENIFTPEHVAVLIGQTGKPLCNQYGKRTATAGKDPATVA
jgi:hypothetical protein